MHDSIKIANVYYCNRLLMKILPKPVLLLQLCLQRHVCLHLLLHFLHYLLIIHLKFLNLEHKHLQALPQEHFVLELVR